ncbi:MAG: hypothetical protein WC295_02760 [Methanoregula sp.]|jgi:hypothetical protein
MLEKYSDWDYTHPRLLWGGIFIGCFVVAFLIAIGITTTAPSLIISNESARLVISTLNQIQATILAIVISLTILAVEMTASKYSPRVIEIFKNNVSMWVFLFSYIISITIGSIFLTFIDSPNFPISTTTGTLFLLSLGIFLIFMLVPYVLSTLDFLNIERIIKRLAGLIRVDTINAQIDPFQSVFDVIYGAIKINDFTTMSTGLVIIEERFKEIIANDPANWQNDYISFRFFDDIKRCGFLLVEKKEDKYAFEIITRLNTLSEWAFKEQYTIVLHWSCIAIEKIAVNACEHGLVSVVDHAINSLKEISESVEKIDGLFQKAPVTEKWSRTLYLYIESISNIGKAAVTSDLSILSERIIDILEYLGKYAISKKLMFASDVIIKQINAMIFESQKQKKNEITDIFIERLQVLGIQCIRESRTKEVNWVLTALRNIGKFAAHQQNGLITRRVVVTIRYIALDALEKGMTDIANIAIECSKKFQLVYPAFFKDQKEIQLFNYKNPDSISMSKEIYDMVISDEFFQLFEYLYPPDNYDDGFNDGKIDVSL